MAFNNIHRFVSGIAQELLLEFWHQPEPPEAAERGAAGCLVPTAPTSATHAILQCCPVALHGWATQEWVEDSNTDDLGVFCSAHVLGMSLGCSGSRNKCHCLVTDGQQHQVGVYNFSELKITVILNRVIDDFFFLKKGIFPLDVSFMKEVGRRWDPTTPDCCYR